MARFGYLDAPETVPAVPAATSEYPEAALAQPVWATSDDDYARLGRERDELSSRGEHASAAAFVLSNRHGIAMLGNAEEYHPPIPPKGRKPSAA